MDVTVVYPAYNEENALRETVEKSLIALRKLDLKFEILVIDDCSRDGTASEAATLMHEFPEVRVLQNERNLGQGATLKRGFREARGEFVIHNGVDYPFDLEDFGALYNLTNECDIVVASRRGQTGQGAYRAVLSTINRILLRLLFPLKLTDYNFVQLYRKFVLDTVQVETNSTAFLTPELLIRSHKAGFVIREVPVTYHPRRSGQATAGNPKVVIRSLCDLLGFWLRMVLSPGRSPDDERNASVQGSERLGPRLGIDGKSRKATKVS